MDSKQSLPICSSNIINSDSIEDIKVFIKFSNSNNTNNTHTNTNKRSLFFEENREVIYSNSTTTKNTNNTNTPNTNPKIIPNTTTTDLSNTDNSNRKYKFDYIFSEYESTSIITEAIKYNIFNALKTNDKNVTFFSIGESEKSDFMFGMPNVFQHESFFCYCFDFIINLLQNKFDIILIDYFKTHKDKYVIDLINIQFAFQANIVDFLNYLSGGVDEKNCNTVVVFKFFKFSTENDISQIQREVNLTRTVSFIDIEEDKPSNNSINFGGSSSVGNENNVNLKNNTPNTNPTPISPTPIPSNNHGYISAFQNFSNIIDSLYNMNLDLYPESNCINTALFTETLRIDNSFIIFFGFVDPYLLKLKESFNLLDILNKAKYIKTEPFYNTVHFNFESLINDSKYSKQEFYNLEFIVSLYIFNITLFYYY